MSPRKKKTYLAIIALGGVALLVDRLLLPAPITGPDAAVAQAAPIGAQLAAGTNGGVPRTAAWAIPELPFPQGLSAYRAGTEFRDLFAPPGSQWSHGTNDHSADGSESAPGARGNRGTTAAAFADHHAVSGVVIIASWKIAVVDGKWVRIGESIGGCTVTAIRENEAVFRCRDGDTSLKVIAPPGRQGG